MKKRKYQKFTSADIDKLVALNDQGYNNTYIGEVLGRNANQVAQKKFSMRLKQGVPSDHIKRKKRKGRWSAAELLSLKQMYYKRSLDVKEISSMLGRSEKSIWQKIQDLEKAPNMYEETTILWGLVKFKYPVR